MGGFVSMLTNFTFNFNLNFILNVARRAINVKVYGFLMYTVLFKVSSIRLDYHQLI